MMCAYILQARAQRASRRAGCARWSRNAFERLLKGYGRALDWALKHAPMMLLLLLGIVGLNIYMFVIIPKGFFPRQDLGQLNGGMRADQSISFQAMQGKLQQLVDIIRADPAVATVVGFTGGNRAGGGFMFATLEAAVGT